MNPGEQNLCDYWQLCIYDMVHTNSFMIYRFSPMIFLFLILFLNSYFVGNISSAGTQVWRQDAMFGTHLFLQRMGETTILLEKMLTSDTLTLQSPTEESHGSQLPWHCSSSSQELHFSFFLTSYSQVTWRVIVLRHMVSCSWVFFPFFLVC